MNMSHNRDVIAVFFFLSLFSVFSGSAIALSAPPAVFNPIIVTPPEERFTREIILDNLESPWAMDFIDDDNLLITEHGGHLVEFSKKTGKRIIADFSSLVAHGEPQLGLLDVAAHKLGKKTYIYMSYTAQKKQGNADHFTTCIMRRRWEEDKLTTDNKKKFCVGPWGKETSQFGGAIAFDQKNHVFLSVGDRAQRGVSQKKDALWGKILAFNDSMLNVNQPLFHGDHGKLIWSMGHRNPQGLFYDKTSQKLYSSEHGPEGGDEINIIEQDANYGWPVITYGHEYKTHIPIGEGTVKPGMQQPLYYYTPSIATSGMMVYHGNMFPEWENHIFVGALAGQHLNHLTIQNSKVTKEERMLSEMHSRVRDVKTGPDGAIYVLMEKGILLRLSKK